MEPSWRGSRDTAPPGAAARGSPAPPHPQRRRGAVAQPLDCRVLMCRGEGEPRVQTITHFGHERRRPRHAPPRPGGGDPIVDKTGTATPASPATPATPTAGGPACVLAALAALGCNGGGAGRRASDHLGHEGRGRGTRAGPLGAEGGGHGIYFSVTDVSRHAMRPLRLVLCPAPHRSHRGQRG